MRPGPVARTVRGGLTRRRVQTIVISLVLLVSTGASVLGLALAVDSDGPFDQAFASQHGADVVAAIDSARATPAELAATTRLPQVIAAAGPLAEVTITSRLDARNRCRPTPSRPCSGAQAMPSMTLAGRASPGGPVDDVTLQSGHWARRTGQLVLSSGDVYLNDNIPPGTGLGAQLTVTGVPGKPTLTVVGIANSISDSADGWVVPGEVARLRAARTPASAQMLYRFRSARTGTAIRADVAAVTAALPAGAVAASQSYLTVRAQEASGIAVIWPFVVAFGIIGLLMSVLIVINVVSGAVVAGYRRIGILKSIGFTPGQVVAAYTGQAMIPAAAGCLGGVVLGNLLAVPLLGKTASAYGVGTLGVPAWVDAAVAAAMCLLVGIAALLPALRAGRLSAVAAIAAGRAPRPGRGYAAHRLLGRLPLPRPVTIGLAGPFARPARTAVTLAAVLLGATAVTLTAGLGGSLSRVVDGLSLVKTEQVQVVFPANGPQASPGGPGRGTQPVHGSAPAGAGPPPAGAGSAPAGPPPTAAAAQRTIAAALRAQPGTLHYVAEADQQVSVAGIAQQIPVTAYRGAAGWTGYGMISGHWYTGPDQADVPTNFLAVTGKVIGDTVTITFGGQQIPVRIAGEVFDSDNSGLAMITDWQTLARADRRLTPYQYDVGLRPGTSAAQYAQAVQAALGPGYMVSLNYRNQRALPIVLGLLGTLTLLLAVVAGLGVLNTVVLQTRERVHDLGVFKAVGMTPRQVIAMVLCWVAGAGLLAGVIAVPAGIGLQRYLMPVVVAAAGTGLPASYLNVYRGGELVALALAGVVIAVAGALLPAAWAAGAGTASALRAE
jgi:putative ABC transport system permease protein